VEIEEIPIIAVLHMQIVPKIDKFVQKIAAAMRAMRERPRNETDESP
jgi:hypothetical protein